MELKEECGTRWHAENSTHDAHGSTFHEDMHREGKVDTVKCLTPPCCCDQTKGQRTEIRKVETRLLFSFT